MGVVVDQCISKVCILVYTAAFMHMKLMTKHNINACTHTHNHF